MNNPQHFNINLKQIVPEYYSKNKFVRRLFFKRIKIAVDYCNKIKPQRILDIGCGDGTFVTNLKQKGNFDEIIGIDKNAYVEELNKTITGAKFIRCDILNLPFKKKKFDVVVSLDVFEHLENLERALKNIKKIIKKKGFLIVSGPREDFFYKVLRFIIKGTFSQEKGPGAGIHYHNIKQIDKMIREKFYFALLKKIKIKFLFFHLFDVNLYKLKE